MTAIFYPKNSIARRYRYPSENKGKTFSYLHNKESEFRLDNLEKHQNWQLNLFAINYNNEDKHEGVKLHYCKTNIFYNNHNENENAIIIKTNQIKFDFIEIEIIKKSKLKGKQRENLRILALLKDTKTSEELKVISKIIRNKGAGVKDDLHDFLIGRPPSASNWRKFFIFYKNYLLYYPEEMTLRINETIISCSTETDSSIQYNSYEFLIPEYILEKKEELKCVLECLPFQKSETFSHKFFDVDKRKRKPCESISQEITALTIISNSSQSENENMDMSHQVHNIVDKSDEPFPKKPLLEVQNSDLYMTAEAETVSDMNFRNVNFNFNSKNEIINFLTESERSPGVESENNSNLSFSTKGFLDDFISSEETDNLISICNPDLFLELDDINDILNRYPL